MASTSNISCLQISMAAASTTPYMILHSATMILAIFVNIIVMITVCSSNRLRTTTHVLIVSSAVSDLAFSTQGLVLIAVVAYREHNRPCEDILQNSFKFLRNQSISASYLNIFLVSIERWLFIARPFIHERIISRKLIMWSLISVWGCSLILSFDAFISPSLQSRFEHTKLTIVYPCGHWALAIVICTVYTHVSIISRRQTRLININNPISQYHTRMAENQQVKITSLKAGFKSLRLLFAVFGAFFLLLTPGHCFNLYTMIFTGYPNKDFYNITKECVFVHCCCNFFVIYRYDARFRRVLITLTKKIGILRCCKTQVGNT
ncbi:unnamed protein product [Candidula unifasciata]|uniref:G-protein coupled receptors family 1 profile domain-containing protein n=1 Tax=Candidula unifasciata TaxID=100452 RepID=A0A8S3Z9N5_9EUPU|nr:unnamed protein product [Candidula unifasciata]